MSAQRLGRAAIRRIARSTGLDVTRGWAHGGYTFDFVTRDHQHGCWDKKTGEWAFDPEAWHYTSCHEDEDYAKGLLAEVPEWGVG